jgi:hypothetical protein
VRPQFEAGPARPLFFWFFIHLCEQKCARWARSLDPARDGCRMRQVRVRPGRRPRSVMHFGYASLGRPVHGAGAAVQACAERLPPCT